jgi:pimeloyl-ACP methyl ester carboxylesterase
MTTATPAAEHSQLTAPNLTVHVANGVRYAYRRFGPSDERRPPLLFLQHFRGNLDNWDALLGFLFQYPRQFAALVTEFLSAD